MTHTLLIEITIQGQEFVELSLVDNFAEIDEDNIQPLQINGKQAHLLTIQFNEKMYSIGTDTPDSISQIITEIIQNPNGYKLYTILFNGKEYQLTGECLLAIILHELFKCVQNKEKIQSVELNIETEVDIPLVSYSRTSSCVNINDL